MSQKESDANSASIFISYSREDSAEANALAVIFWSMGMKVWMDRSDIPPGTPQWDKEIRSALKNAICVVAICSESARSSEYVAIEIAIAKASSVPIIPVWIKGEVWTDSAPMSLTLSQHVDLRKGKRKANMKLLRDGVVNSVVHYNKYWASKKSWKNITVWNGLESIHCSPYELKNWGSLLNKVYLELCKNQYAPHTYGEQWALRSKPAARADEWWAVLCMPAPWAARPFSRARTADENWELKSIIDWPGPECRELEVIGCRKLEKILKDGELSEHRQGFLGRWYELLLADVMMRSVHPKQASFDLWNRQKEQKEHRQAHELFEQEVPGFEVVVPKNEYLDEADRDFGTLEGIEVARAERKRKGFLGWLRGR